MMLTGITNSDLEAILRLEVRGPAGQALVLDTLIDTGFNGYVALSRTQIAVLGLLFHSREVAELADASFTSVRRFQGVVIWQSRERDVIVVEMDGGPMIGMSLLEGTHVGIDVVDGGPVTIQPLAAPP